MEHTYVIPTQKKSWNKNEAHLYCVEAHTCQHLTDISIFTRLRFIFVFQYQEYYCQKSEATEKIKENKPNTHTPRAIQNTKSSKKKCDVLFTFVLGIEHRHSVHVLTNVQANAISFLERAVLGILRLLHRDIHTQYTLCCTLSVDKHASFLCFTLRLLLVLLLFER